MATFLETEPANESMANFVTGHGVQVAADGSFSNAIMLRDWPQIWLAFAAYALVIAIAFAIMFKHKHDPKEVANVVH